MADKPVEAPENDGLSPQEFAALNEKDESISELEEIIAEADEPEQDDPEEDEPDEADEPEEDEPIEEAAQAKDDVVEAAVEPPPTVAQVDFSGAIADLKRQFEDGEIDLPEYLDQRDAITEARIAQKISSQMAEQAADRAWQDANAAFFERHSEYSAKENPKLFSVLQAVLDQTAANPANSRLSYDALLMTAKANLEEAIGAPPGEKTKESPKAKPRLVSDRNKLPPSLKDIPAAAAPRDGGGEFTGLDRLSGMDLEAAVARLTPEQQRRWAETG